MSIKDVDQHTKSRDYRPGQCFDVQRRDICGAILICGRKGSPLHPRHLQQRYPNTDCSSRRQVIGCEVFDTWRYIASSDQASMKPKTPRRIRPQCRGRLESFDLLVPFLIGDGEIRNGRTAVSSDATLRIYRSNGCLVEIISARCMGHAMLPLQDMPARTGRMDDSSGT